MWALGLSVGPHVPLILRGPETAASVDSRRDLGLPDVFERLVEDLYAEDPLLGPALAQAMALRAASAPANQAEPGTSASRRLGGSVGRLLAAPDGPHAAVLEINGWDTHTGQSGALKRQLAGLADTVLGLREVIGSRWSDTAGVVITEFGRRVALNGTGGSDHGAGGVAFVFGGAIRGGAVVADWPGLAPGDLLDGRDLRPTRDLRSVAKALCITHLGLDPEEVDRVVFPGSRAVPPCAGLL